MDGQVAQRGRSRWAAARCPGSFMFKDHSGGVRGDSLLLCLGSDWGQGEGCGVRRAILISPGAFGWPCLTEVELSHQNLVKPLHFPGTSLVGTPSSGSSETFPPTSPRSNRAHGRHTGHLGACWLDHACAAAFRLRPGNRRCVRPLPPSVFT